MEHDRNNQEEPTLDVSLDVESNFDEMLSALRVGVQKPSADRDAYNEDSIKCSSDSPQTDLDAYVAPNSEGCDPYLQTPPGGLDAEHGQVVTTNGYENCAIERENSALEDRKSLDSSAEDFEDEVVHHDIQETNCNDDQPVAPPTEETEVTTQAEEIQHTLEDDGESEVKSPTAIHDAETSEELVHDAHAVDEGWAKDDYPTIRRYSGATVDEDDYEVPKTQLSEELASLTVSADAKEDESACNAMNGFPPETDDAPAEVSDKEEENACHTTDDWSPAAHEAAAESDAPNEEVDVGCCAKCGDRVRMSEEVGAKGKTFHKECFRCIKCSCPLITNTCQMAEGQLYCESHYSEMLNSDEDHSLREDDTVRHSDAVVNEDELPEPEYTKSMIAKFQQPQQSSPPSQNAMNTPKVGKVKTPDFLNNNEKPSPEPSAPIDDVLPPTGSAKRLVEQWSTIVSQEKPQPADEHYYPPNTAKMIAAKFSAGLFNEDTESRAGDRSSPKVTRNGHTGECMGNGDQMDPELPAEGMTRDLIAKFSVREA
uniref:LIM domain-containing protein PLIM2c n=1 Tax=Schistocephalus solidus TaxID=70667 RepID=A0A0X3P3N3_SCHSO